MREITKEDFSVTNWSGGQTTQLYIYPEGSDFSKRDFDFRISSASFNSTKSKFSDFSGYQRYILPLKGFIKLDHKGLYNRSLEAYEPEYFDGRWETNSENTLETIDYNFIVKNGSEASMEIVKGIGKVINQGYRAYIFSEEDYDILIEGTHKTLKGGNLYIIDEDFEVKSLKSNLIVCRYKELIKL